MLLGEVASTDTYINGDILLHACYTFVALARHQPDRQSLPEKLPCILLEGSLPLLGVFRVISIVHKRGFLDLATFVLSCLSRASLNRLLLFLLLRLKGHWLDSVNTIGL